MSDPKRDLITLAAAFGGEMMQLKAASTDPHSTNNESIPDPRALIYGLASQNITKTEDSEHIKLVEQLKHTVPQNQGQAQVPPTIPPPVQPAVAQAPISPPVANVPIPALNPRAQIPFATNPQHAAQLTLEILYAIYGKLHDIYSLLTPKVENGTVSKPE